MLSPLEKRSRELSKAIASFSFGKKATLTSKKRKTTAEQLADLAKYRTEPKIEVKEKKVFLGKPGTNGQDGLSIKGDKGERGLDGKDGTTPLKGIHYFTADEIESIKAEILSKIKLPEVKDGKMPEIDDEFVKTIVQRMAKLPEQHKLEVQGIRNFQSFVYKGTRYGMEEMMHGGANASSGGSTLTAETPIGIVDDSNMTFTVSNTPLYIVVSGGQYTVGNGIFASYAAGTITLNAPVGSTGFITSYYNA